MCAVISAHRWTNCTVRRSLVHKKDKNCVFYESNHIGMTPLNPKRVLITLPNRSFNLQLKNFTCLREPFHLWFCYNCYFFPTVCRTAVQQNYSIQESSYYRNFSVTQSSVFRYWMKNVTRSCSALDVYCIIIRTWFNF